MYSDDEPLASPGVSGSPCALPRPATHLQSNSHFRSTGEPGPEHIPERDGVSMRHHLADREAGCGAFALTLEATHAQESALFHEVLGKPVFLDALLGTVEQQMQVTHG